MKLRRCVHLILLPVVVALFLLLLSVTLPTAHAWIPVTTPIVVKKQPHSGSGRRVARVLMISTQKLSSPFALSASLEESSVTTAFAATDTDTTTASPLYTLDGHAIRGQITPLGNIVLVQVKETVVATSGGLFLPDQAKQRPTEGVVVAVGPGKIHPDTALRITNPIHVGMSVLYGPFDGRPMQYNGEECQVLRDDNILLAYRSHIVQTLDHATPIRDYVLIEINHYRNQLNDLKTRSGVAIASQVMKDLAICEGRVVKVGEGRMASVGTLTQSPVKPGDYVKWKDYAGNEITIEGKEYSLVKMVDILATRKE